MEPSVLLLYKKKRAKIRLSYLLLDIFLGGFIVAVVLMTTLGRPESAAPSFGSGGEPFILVEFFWDGGHHLYSPIVYYSNDPNVELNENHRRHQMGFASPITNSGSSVWLPYQILTGYFNLENTFPAARVGMDGFYLESTHTLKVLFSERDQSLVNQQYGYLWVENPCYGKWKFELRHVEDALSNNPQNVMVKLSYSFGEMNTQTQVSGETLEKKLAVHPIKSSLYETISSINEIEVKMDSEVLKRIECP